MRLTKHTDLSLRLLMYLGLRADEIHTIPDLARRFNASKDHLVKVVGRMASHGYVIATRGRGGGVSLAKPAHSIRIGAVVADMEQTLEVVDCEDGPCPFLPVCRLRPLLNDATRAFLRTLDEYTLADLLKNEKQLLRVVG
jgi:Rrf2 family nitric oxide-sensitive transcriptional repressor